MIKISVRDDSYQFFIDDYVLILQTK
jgi:hypothetical protein